MAIKPICIFLGAFIWLTSFGADDSLAQTEDSLSVPARLTYNGRLTLGEGAIAVEAVLDFPLNFLFAQRGESNRMFPATYNYQYKLPANCHLTNTAPSGSHTFSFYLTEYPDIRQFEIQDNGSLAPLSNTPSMRCQLNSGGFEDSLAIAGSAIPLVWLFGQKMDPFNGFSSALDTPEMAWSLKLVLACNVQQARSATSPLINVSPPGNQPWPLTLDHSKTDVEITALKSVPSRLNAGLTLFHAGSIHVTINWDDPVSANFGPGVCFGVKDVSIEFGPIEMYIDTKYPESSCQYQATLEHENKHYKTYSDILRVYQQYLSEQISRLTLPTKAQPAYAAESDVENLKSQLETKIRAVGKSTISTMLDQMRQETSLLEQETAAVQAKCSQW